MRKGEARVVRAQGGELFEVAGVRDAHGVGAQGEADGTDVAVDVFAVGADQVLRGVVEELCFAGVEQPAAQGGGAVVLQGVVGGKQGARRFGGADALVFGVDVAEGGACVDDVVPAKRVVVFFRREVVEQEVADEPCGLLRQGGVQSVAFGLRGDAPRDVQGHGADDVAGAYVQGLAGVVLVEEDADVVGMFGDVQGGGRDGGRCCAGCFRRLFEGFKADVGADAAAQVGKAVRPGEYGVVVMAACREVVQAGKGGDVRDALAVVVAAAVVEIPEEVRRAVVFTGEPLREGEVVELPPLPVGAAVDDGDGEDFASVGATRVFEGLDEGVEAAAVAVFLRQEAVLPLATVEEAFSRGVDEVFFAVAVGGEDVEVGEEVADVGAFLRGEGEVVCAARRGKSVMVVARAVAVAFRPFGDEDVAVSLAVELPRGGESRSAAAEDEGVAGVAGVCGGQGGLVAQAVADG